MEFDQTRKVIHVWFFAGRSIGVTLLGLHALRTAKSAAADGQEVRTFLVLTENKQIYEEMLLGYPNVTLVVLHWRNIRTVLKTFLESALQRNIFLYPPAFGLPPFLARLFSSLLCFFNVQSQVVGFVDTRVHVRSFFYHWSIPIDYQQNIFHAVVAALQQLLPVKVSAPEFLYQANGKLREQLPEKFMVFHPYASGEGRTYPDSLTLKLVSFLLEKYTDYILLISAGPSDLARANKLIEDVAGHDGRLKLLEEYDVYTYSDLAQMIDESDLFIGVDTGITHLAANLKTPVIVLGNLSNPMWLPDYSVQTTVLVNRSNCTCKPDKTGQCITIVDGKQYYKCMADIPWQDITSAIRLHLHD